MANFIQALFDHWLVGAIFVPVAISIWLGLAIEQISEFRQITETAANHLENRFAERLPGDLTDSQWAERELDIFSYGIRIADRLRKMGEGKCGNVVEHSYRAFPGADQTLRTSVIHIYEHGVDRAEEEEGRQRYEKTLTLIDDIRYLRPSAFRIFIRDPARRVVGFFRS